jgi:hypothetical protein
VGPRTGLDAVARKKNMIPFRELNPDRPARSLVTTLTELLQLHKKKKFNLFLRGHKSLKNMTEFKFLDISVTN